MAQVAAGWNIGSLININFGILQVRGFTKRKENGNFLKNYIFFTLGNIMLI